MHAHTYHDICIIFEGSKAEKIRNDLIRDGFIRMLRELEKMTLLFMAGLTSMLNPNSSLHPTEESRAGGLLLMQGIDGQSFLEVTEGKILLLSV